MKPPAWPDLPFAIINEVPLSMNLGYVLGGRAELAGEYLVYCKANGTFRTRLFPKVTSLTASNALNQVFSSSAWSALKWQDEGTGWSYSLSEGEATQMLWKQVENITKASPKGK